MLKQCFCYSLRQGSFIIGTYSLIVYCVAFAVELWWIAEALLILPAPAYALCALYFFNFVMAAILLFGLLVRQRKCLMSWTLMTALSFFPEAGMVLFMSLYYWPTQKYEYGVIELIYWSLRAIFNIFGALCVCSLYLSWRDEALILERLTDLNLANLERGHAGIIGFQKSIRRHNQRGRLNPQISTTNTTNRYHSNKNLTLGYHNFGYSLDSPPSQSDDYQTLQKHSQFRSRTSSHPTTQYHSQHRRLGSRPSVNIKDGNPRKYQNNELNPALIFDPTLRKSRISELGIAGVGLEPRFYPSSALQRTKSLWNVTNDDYWERAPPSRPVSLGYVNHTLALKDNSKNNNTYLNHVEGRKQWMMGMVGRRAASVDGLNHFHRYYNNRPNNYQLGRNWSKSSIDSEEEYYVHRDRSTGGAL